MRACGCAITFARYTAESPTTCGGYPASANHEDLDAKTMAGWCVVGSPRLGDVVAVMCCFGRGAAVADDDNHSADSAQSAADAAVVPPPSTVRIGWAGGPSCTRSPLAPGAWTTSKWTAAATPSTTRCGATSFFNQRVAQCALVVVGPFFQCATGRRLFVCLLGADVCCACGWAWLWQAAVFLLTG
jgi:hypothetical protein